MIGDIYRNKKNGHQKEGGARKRGKEERRKKVRIKEVRGITVSKRCGDCAKRVLSLAEGNCPDVRHTHTHTFAQRCSGAFGTHMKLCMHLHAYA